MQLRNITLLYYFRSQLLSQRQIKHRCSKKNDRLKSGAIILVQNIYSYPVPCANDLSNIIWEVYKTVRFPRQVAECLTKLPENVSLEHFPFLYRDFLFIPFLVSTDPWWEPDKISVLHTKDWTGEEWIFLQRPLL